MRIKREVSADTIVAVLVLLGSLVGLYMGLDRRLTAVETKLSVVYDRVR